jgi:hypothetical protein
MADLKPLGSEKLTGMEKIQRILDIAKYKETPKQNINEQSSIDYTIQLADGYTYGIVKERLGYIIKKGLNESFLDYSEPMKQRKHFRSYSEAMKKLNLTASELNRVYGNDEGINLIGEQSAQKKKFILKLPKTNSETPDVGGTPPTPPPPAEDMGATPPPPPGEDMGSTPPPPPAEDMGDMTPPGEDMGATPPPPAEDMGATPPPPPGEDMGMEPEMPPAEDFDLEGESKMPSFKSIQRLTGKLSQRLRTMEKDKNLESDDIKYVLNSIISALNLDNLEEDDREDILSKFDESDEYGSEGAGDLDLPSDEDFDMGGMGETMAEPPQEPMPPMGAGGSVVENVLSRYFKMSPSERPILEEKNKKDFLKNQLQKAEIKKEIRNLSETVIQMEKGLNLLENNAKFVGKTNKENLIFTKNGKQIKVTPRGRIL